MEFECIIRDVKVGGEGIIDLADLYKYIKSWFIRHNYDLVEKEYLDTLKEENKIHSIKWEGDKKIDDYVMLKIEVRLKCDNVKEVEVNKKKRSKCNVTFTFKAYLYKDYESNWENSFIQRFLRAVYDKFIISGKLGAYAKELKADTFDMVNEVKSYLKLHKFR